MEVDYTRKKFQSHLYQVLFYFSHFLHIMLIFSFINIFLKYLLFGCTRSQSWHSGSLLFTVAYGTYRCRMQDLFFSPSVAACGIQFLDQVWNPGPQHWEHRVLTTAPPQKSCFYIFDTYHGCLKVHVCQLNHMCYFWLGYVD